METEFSNTLLCVGTTNVKFVIKSEHGDRYYEPICYRNHN